MASNLREGSLGRVHVTAGAARTAGVPIVEDGYVGVPVVDAASGEDYVLDCRVGVLYEITKIGAEAKGDYVYITVSNDTLKLTSAAGDRLFAKVREAENGTIYGTPAGKTLIELLPQSVTA